MKCKWGPVTKHVGVSLVSLSEECACAQGWRREAAEEMGPSAWWHPIASRHNATTGGREVDLWTPFRSQLLMLLPRTSHSAGSVGNSQSELPREKHHRTVIFPNKFIERKSGQMLPRRFQKPLKPQGSSSAWSLLSARFLDAFRPLALLVLKNNTRACCAS